MRANMVRLVQLPLEGSAVATGIFKAASVWKSGRKMNSVGRLITIVCAISHDSGVQKISWPS